MMEIAVEIKLGLAASLGLIFFGLASLHVYWAAGGVWGAKNAIPSVPDEERGEQEQPAFQPGPLATLVVAGGLYGFAALMLALGDLLPFDLGGVLQASVLQTLGYVIAGIFALRVVGDFRFVGLFKKYRTTTFAKSDDRIFIPLCAVLSTGIMFLSL